MSHPITINLTDAEYVALTQEAEETGEEIKDILHELIDQVQARQFRLTYTPDHPLSKHELAVYLYKEGVITHIPEGEPRSDEDETERKRLGDLFGQAGGKPVSEMIIEDRGPY